MSRLLDFSCLVSTHENVNGLTQSFSFMKSLELTTTLSVVPFTEDLYKSVWQLKNTKGSINALENTSFDEFHFLLEYSKVPLVLYSVQYKEGFGGRGDEAWLIKHPDIVKKYFDETASIGKVFDEALLDSGLPPGELIEPFKNRFTNSAPQVSFINLGLRTKYRAEDFFAEL